MTLQCLVLLMPIFLLNIFDVIQAGLRTLQDGGPELTRAVSGSLAPDGEESTKHDDAEPDHRVRTWLNISL